MSQMFLAPVFVQAQVIQYSGKEATAVDDSRSHATIGHCIYIWYIIQPPGHENYMYVWAGRHHRTHDWAL